jgi:hypothetical protein
MMREDPDALSRFRGALAQLSGLIHTLPPHLQGEVFLRICADFLHPLDLPAIIRLQTLLREQFPELDEESDVMLLIEGHIVLRQLCTR